MYLAVPNALPINSNPGMVFPPKKFTTILDVARFAARLVDGTLEHKAVIDKKAIPVEKIPSKDPKVAPQSMCMAQYYRVLGGCRIPGKTHDCQDLPLQCENPDEHVIVVCRNQFYCVPVKAGDRGQLTEDEICSQILYILEDAPGLCNPPPVGILTGWKRPCWAEARESLCKDEKNRRNLELISKSLLVICLDEPLPTTFNSRCHRGAKGHCAGGRDDTNLMVQMLCGGGSSCNSANRWFDKTVQLVISGDGATGLCYEHSMAEGVAVIQLCENLLKRIDCLPAQCDVPAPAGHLPPPERLEWVLEAEDHKRIEAAANFLDNLINDLDFQVFRFCNYGKDFMKTAKVSPDAYVQLAMQLAYYKLYGKLCATYESASTRRFYMGRVDNIRAASPEALAWVQAMAQPKEDDEMGSKKVTFHLVSDEKKLELWQMAVKQQSKETNDNISGQGIDIHLLGLREAAKETSPTAASPLPEIFTDPSYKLANTFLLSTSQVTTELDSFMGYGAVDPEGYGCSYNLKKDCIVFCVAAFLSSECTSASKFVQSLEESLTLMQCLLTRKIP